MADILQEVIERIDLLSEDEQLRLLAYLAQKAHGRGRQPRIKWLDLLGVAPDLLDGEDAQAWVSRMRQDDSQHREALLGR